MHIALPRQSNMHFLYSELMLKPGAMEKLLFDYESPQLKLIQIETEGVFASSDSYLDYRQNPSMPYGDDTEEWF